MSRRLHVAGLQPVAYSLKEAASQAEVSEAFLVQQIHSGRLRAKRIGGPTGRYRIAHSDLVAWFDALPDA